MDKTAITKLCRISWRTVGRIVERVVAAEIDPQRLDGLFRIGVDEISWRKHHKYLTLVVDHDNGEVVWGDEGRDSATLDKFFAELGPERSAQIQAVTADLGPAFLKSITAEGHAPQAIVCADPFHVAKLGGEALDEVRRGLWQQLRRLPDERWAKDFKGARWCLLKKPEDLTPAQAEQLAKIKRTRGGLWRAYEMKEQLRALVTDHTLTRAEAETRFKAWIRRAERSRLAPFIRLAGTIRERLGIILNAVEHGLSNGRVEGFNTKVRLIIRRAYGFHSAKAALALVMLAAGPVHIVLPHEH